MSLALIATVEMTVKVKVKITSGLTANNEVAKIEEDAMKIAAQRLEKDLGPDVVIYTPVYTDRVTIEHDLN